MVVWLLGVPALAGQSTFGGRDPPPVVFATANYAVLCSGGTACNECLSTCVLDKL